MVAQILDGREWVHTCKRSFDETSPKRASTRFLGLRARSSLLYHRQNDFGTMRRRQLFANALHIWSLVFSSRARFHPRC